MCLLTIAYIVHGVENENPKKAGEMIYIMTFNNYKSNKFNLCSCEAAEPVEEKLPFGHRLSIKSKTYISNKNFEARYDPEVSYFTTTTKSLIIKKGW